MRIQLNKQECRWLSDLAHKARMDASLANQEAPNRLFELRRDNMADLENKLKDAMQKEIQKERRGA
ncbi:MAG: hypothetical protein LBK67_04385, partial [Coriobacteriales bacterium]|nr:hypothetical protein [Coriobacteriales bacterium]